MRGQRDPFSTDRQGYGLPGIHVSTATLRSKTWMAGTSPAMTARISWHGPASGTDALGAAA
jgi:hypothetical protein